MTNTITATVDLVTAVKQIKELQELIEEATNEIDALKDILKAHMSESKLTEMHVADHKVFYTDVTSSRVDAAAFKRELPEIAARYTKTTTTKRFEIR